MTKKTPEIIAKTAEPAFLVRNYNIVIKGVTKRMMKNIMITIANSLRLSINPAFECLIVMIVVIATIRISWVMVLSTLNGLPGSLLYELIPEKILV